MGKDEGIEVTAAKFAEMMAGPLKLSRRACR